MNRHGRIFERTVYDPNEFIFKGGFCYIQLYDQKGNKTEKAIIDDVDYSLVKNHKWHLFLAGGKESPEFRYVRSRIKGEGNLRVCTQSQNSCNQKRRKDNTSGYKGVYFHKAVQKWCSCIQYKHKEFTLGYFDTPEEGAEAYNKKALELHGEFARINNNL
jgi:hypothetical protein